MHLVIATGQLVFSRHEILLLILIVTVKTCRTLAIMQKSTVEQV